MESLGSQKNLALSTFGTAIANTTTMKKVYIILSMLCSGIPLSAQDTGKIILKVDGAPNDSGKVRAALFDNPDGFPEELDRGQKRGSTVVIDGSGVIVFHDVPFGSYVLAVFHDENDNGALDKNNKGIPLEALGISNNVKLKLGPPKFEKALFEMNEKQAEVSVSLQQYKASRDTEN